MSSTTSTAASGNIVLPQADYEIIDLDPHFSKVVQYFRGSDYLKIAAFTASGPAFLGAVSYIESSGKSFHVSPRYLRLATFFGLTAGFLNAYSQSSLRFQGAVENSREVSKDRYEVKSRLAKGLNPYKVEESDLPEWIRKVSARTSIHSYNALAFFPWFNLVRHEFHGVSLDKYYVTRPGEESWGFDLKAPEKNE
ncbi:hypothetical protein AWJ20_4516 [Sugiyamaella lignohabitans]|uniref:NADH-ubiquinone oxidoreductase 21 kDa subunit n=1 Tax=Sugiyamaella lignohabitans TaxID=796027 RepID=A0A167CHA4_9ASCO|nr:uncharacterized protein AWJ20_4516 [Sugiyamaella lignohabitans]ANB11695.1 hypothetical protein AWJ20_4516 [Sugiyamaella lignohabitans]